MSRLFTYGCSFTRYEWSTWADIIGSTFREHNNYGLRGTGNLYIFSQLMESISRDKITKDDTIIICWSSITREDRFIDGKWQNVGNLFSEYAKRLYTKEFIEKYVDIEGCFVRDLALIAGAKHSLDNIGCRYRFISMIPITYNNQFFNEEQFYPVFETYKDIISSIGPSFYSFLNFDWDNPEFPHLANDYHPLPSTHLKFVQQYLTEYKISDEVVSKITNETNNIITGVR